MINLLWRYPNNHPAMRGGWLFFGKGANVTPEQVGHLDGIKDIFNSLVDDKYRKGVAEHGGNLWDNPSESLLDMAIDEAIDQVVYLLTLKAKLFWKKNGVQYGINK